MSKSPFIISLFLLSASLFSGSALAQTGLSLRQALEEAQANHPLIEAARAEQTGASHAVSSARSGHLPGLDVTVSGTKGLAGSYGKLGLHGLASSPFKEMYGGSVNLWWTLLDFGRTSGGVQEAKARHGMARHRTDLAVQLVRLEVSTSFYDCIETDQILAAARGLVSQRMARTELVRRQAEHGVSSDVDRALAEADLGRAQAQEQDAVAKQAGCRFLLWAMLGRTPDDSAISTPLETAKGSDPNPNAVADHCRQGRCRPDRLILQHEIKALKGQLGAINAGHLPVLTVTGSGGYANMGADQDPEHYAVGVGVRWPLFEGFRVSSQADSNRARTRAAQARLKAHDLIISAELKSAQAQYSAGKRRLELSSQAMPAAEQALQLARQQFEAGLIDALKLSAGELALWEARRELAAANAAVGQARAALIYAIGKPSGSP